MAVETAADIGEVQPAWTLVGATLAAPSGGQSKHCPYMEMRINSPDLSSEPFDMA
ncbi:MAG: hypothetical protein WCO51_07720 [bacterium]